MCDLFSKKKSLKFWFLEKLSDFLSDGFWGDFLHKGFLAGAKKRV